MKIIICKNLKFFVIVLVVFAFIGCNKKFSIIEDFSKKKFILINQNNDTIYFPENYKNKILIVGYIFTNCPDICPLTTNNMRLIQDRLKREKIDNIELISISFDPLQDSPEVLKSFAEIRNLDLSNWDFLTGNKLTIDSLMKKAGIVVIPSDTTHLYNGRKIYYYVHTDRIQLFDKEGRVIKNYVGSKINIDEVINDIKEIF